MEQVTISGGTGFLDVNKRARAELPQALRIALATGQLRRPLATTLGPVFELLVDGDYRVSGPERLSDDQLLSPTDTWPPSDEARVGYYRTAIRSGHRPVAVVLADGERELIIDGHHKIAAYRAEAVAPAIVRITQAYSPS
ncbi:hypothetical protein ACIA5G_07320 [Amycolatopsis sp. NPDC051758]|uniref:hypothetical protein n=1 Tax=Amycolatopsis sp. NPDC051758 TaxID=3363935 RepID=UPI0037B923BE